MIQYFTQKTFCPRSIRKRFNFNQIWNKKQSHTTSMIGTCNKLFGKLTQIIPLIGFFQAFSLALCTHSFGRTCECVFSSNSVRKLLQLVPKNSFAVKSLPSSIRIKKKRDRTRAECSLRSLMERENWTPCAACICFSAWKRVEIIHRKMRFKFFCQGLRRFFAIEQQFCFFIYFYFKYFFLNFQQLNKSHYLTQLYIL